jgi:hypothetical protein
MNLCLPNRLWSRCFLVGLVLFVVGSALCTVAGSTAGQERRSAGAAASP